MPVAPVIILLISVRFTSGFLTGGVSPKCFFDPGEDAASCPEDVALLNEENNARIFPRLSSLLSRDYFRFYKVNLKKKCPFWADDSHCTIKFCGVETCDERNLPPGLKPPVVFRKLTKKNGDCADYNAELGFLNTSISVKTKKDINLWESFDDSLDNFCLINENDEEAEYVDLLLNPERYTGFHGRSAHKIWNTIYRENCFTSTESYKTFLERNLVKDTCLEERVFYTAVSGLHTSINIHLCANYLRRRFASAVGWEANLDEFLRRFSPETTEGEGPKWLRNLYFLYMLEMRALEKASAYLEKEEFFTGNLDEDVNTQRAVKDLLKVARTFQNSFNESNLFADQNERLKKEFKQHFRNISLIMDCVGCDKCKLWGKLQTQGLGTALKILFSQAFSGATKPKSEHQLLRTEIVSLINSLGRLSTSIFKLDEFQKMIQN